MNPHAFDEWLELHRSINPGFAAYMDKLPEDFGMQVIAEWSRMMIDVELTDAIAASRRLRDRETQPRYERHPVEVRRIALDIARPRETAKFSGTGAFARCNRCKDSGFVEIFLVGEPLIRWLRLYANCARSQHTKHADEQGAMVRCDCAAGSAKASAMEQYDPKRHTLHIGKRRYATEDDDRWLQRDAEVDDAKIVLAQRDRQEIREEF